MKTVKDLSEIELPMAKPNKIPSGGIAPNPDAEEPNKPSPGDDAYEAWEDNVDLQKIRDILGNHDISGGKVRLERKGPTDQVYQYITSIPIEQFDIDHVKKTFGGGDYIARTFRANGQMFKPFNFSIDYRFKGALDEAAIKEMRAAPAQDQSKIIDAIGRVAGESGSSTMAMIKVMEMAQKQQENSTALLMKLMMDSQERQMAMMTQMFAAAKPAPQQQIDFGTAITPILLEMIKNKSASPIGETINMMKQLRDFSTSEKEPEPEKEEDMFEKLLKVGLSALPGIIQAQPGPITNGQRSVSPMPNQSLPPRELQMANMKVKLFTEQLIRAAQKDSDPLVYYELIRDMLNDEQVVMLKQTLTDDHWRVNLFGPDPRIDQCLGWFEELRQLVLNDGCDPHLAPSASADTENDNNQTESGGIQPTEQRPTDSSAS